MVFSVVIVIVMYVAVCVCENSVTDLKFRYYSLRVVAQLRVEIWVVLANQKLQLICHARRHI